MQHTDKYQFNLIDRDDPFTPDALNDNANKLEAALERHSAEVAGVLAAKGNCQIVTGSYVGNGKFGDKNKNTITFEGAPLLLIVQGDEGFFAFVGTEKVSAFRSNHAYLTPIYLTWEENSVSWYSGEEVIAQLNSKDVTYHYILFYQA